MTERPDGPLWRQRRFATYWIGQAVSEFGDRISELAVPLIAVTTLSATATQVGVLTAAVWAPNLVSLVIGSWVDQRPSKRRLLISADVFRFMVLLSIPLADAFGAITLGQLVVVALLAGTGGVLYHTAYPAFFVALVRRDQYVEANSLLSGTRSVSFVAGPAVGGFVIQVLTAPVAVAVDALSFLVSALMISRVKVTEAAVDTHPDEGLMRRARAGMVFVVRHPYLKASLGCATTLNFFSFVAYALVILFASRILGLSAGEIGLAFGVGAIGGLIGAVVAGRLGRLFGAGRTIAFGAVMFTAPIALIPLAAGPHWTKAGVLAVVELLSGFGIMCFDINLNALQAAVTPDAMRSRVSGAFSTINYGIRPLGAIVGGALGQTLGVGPTLVLAAIGGSLSFLWLLPSPIISTRNIAEVVPLD